MSAAVSHEVPEYLIDHFQQLGFDVSWGPGAFGELLMLYVQLPELGIAFTGEGYDADAIYEDAWRHYVAFYMDTVLAWRAATEEVTSYGLRVMT